MGSSKQQMLAEERKEKKKVSALGGYGHLLRESGCAASAESVGVLVLVMVGAYSGLVVGCWCSSAVMDRRRACAQSLCCIWRWRFEVSGDIVQIHMISCSVSVGIVCCD